MIKVTPCWTFDPSDFPIDDIPILKRHKTSSHSAKWY